MRRLLVNDQLSALGERTFWHLLKEWFQMEECTGDYATLAQEAVDAIEFFNPDEGYAGDEPGYSLVIRNATWFPPITVADRVRCPQISLLQDIITEGPQRVQQHEVMASSKITVFNSEFTRQQYCGGWTHAQAVHASHRVIPLPVDFSVFEPQNAMGCQQALGLPDGCICWIGASQGAAGHVKGWDIMQSIARHNPDLRFVCVFKDAIPETMPPNMRCYERVSHEELVRIIGACRVGLCTSRMESQHLAGIEMGACGLPLVVPNSGIYWKRTDLPTYIASENATPGDYAVLIRPALVAEWRPGFIRETWQKEFDIPVVRAQWEKLVAEVECSGQS